MLLRSAENTPTKKGRYKKAALIFLGVPLVLIAAYALEALNNPSLLSRKYLVAQYGPTVLWPLHNGYNAFYLNESFAASSLMAIGNLFGNLDPGVADIPDLVLDVKFKEMNKIFEQREQAMRRGKLIQTDDSFVKGKIRDDSGDIPIKLRLKGDWLDHIQGRKWSYRIHTRKGEQYFGMRRFSVQHPKTRSYHAEALYFDVLSDFGVLVPRIMLVNLMLNGEDLGIMAIEEHFSKELLESQSRREGIIVRFDESLVWLSPDGSAVQHFGGIYDDYRNATVDTFQTSKVLESPVFSKHLATATGLLRGFANGDLRASEVFDVDTLGAYLAITEAFGAHHALRWHNLRFYVNPITLKLEPIGFDANLGKRAQDNESVIRHEPMAEAMLRDPLVMARFRDVLQQLAATAESGALLETLMASEQRFLDILRTEFVYLRPYPVAEVPARTLHLAATADDSFLNAETREVVGLVSAEQYPVPLHAYRMSDGEAEYLELRNAIPYAVEVAGLAPQGVGSEPPLLAASGFPLTLSARVLDSVGDSIRIPIPRNLQATDLLVTGSAGGKAFSLPVVNYAPALNEPGVPVGRIDTILADYDFLELNTAARSISVAPGSWAIPELISLPEGYSLSIKAGTSLRFGRDAGLIVRGPVSLVGSAKQPVQLGPVDASAGWLGIAVLNAQGPSELEHVEIEGTRGMAYGPWLLMGGTNFYRSPVAISATSIKHHKGEDGLNIISTNFTTNGLIVEDTLSDGFDCDFCTGEVIGGRFSQIGTAGGGDAIDVSLSDISVAGTLFDDVSDKAVSIGEQSRATATAITVTNSGTGAAAKDGSFLLLQDSKITGAKVAALMAYIKKPEFGAAELIASNLTLSGNRTTAVAQTGSRIEIDGVAVRAEDVDVDAMYDTIMRPGLRRPKAESEPQTESEQNDAGT